MKKILITTLFMITIIFSGLAFGQTVQREPEIKYDVNELQSSYVTIYSLLEDKYYRLAIGSNEDRLHPRTDTIEELNLAKMMANYDNTLDADGVIIATIEYMVEDKYNIYGAGIYLNNSIDGKVQWVGTFSLKYDFLFVRNAMIAFLKDYLYNFPTANLSTYVYFTEEGTYVPRSMINFH